ncbi:MAG: phytanoyl-CoA dioxygenase family protein [Pseudomonadales bacterium]
MKLTTLQMAEFVASGVLCLEAVVPEELNARFLSRVQSPIGGGAPRLDVAYRRLFESAVLPALPPGVDFFEHFEGLDPLDGIFSLSSVRGAIESLVGCKPRFDHHFLHLTMGQEPVSSRSKGRASQHTHQDSTIDPRRAFDIQLFYFPQAVTAAMGGTRYVPGSHLRIVSESAIARYQNVVGQQHIVCPAGSIYIFHMGIWHGAGLNVSATDRYLYKVRLAPSQPQVRLWNTSDLDCSMEDQRPIFWIDPKRSDPIAERMMRLEPWYEADTGRLELINRLKLWRYLTGSPDVDIDYWLTRIENDW